MRGLLIVISGPSGVGKGTVCRELLRRTNAGVLSVSVTTRRPRQGEIDGKDYSFVSKDKFREMINQGQLLEWAAVYKDYYGTPRAPVFRALESGWDVILEIDVQGALKVKNTESEAVLVFIYPPSESELKKRLVNRGTEAADIIETRLSWAQEELRAYDAYDYVVVNDEVSRAAEKIEAILVAEKCRVDYFSRYGPQRVAE